MSRPSLVGLVVRRIAFFAALAMLAQLAGVFWEYWSDDQTLERYAIEMETEALAQGVSVDNGRAAFHLPPDLRDRYGGANSGYVVRVRTAAGAQLYSNCPGACETLFPPIDVTPLMFWMRQVKPGEKLEVGGGRVVVEQPEPVMIEIAIVDDRDGVMARVFRHEVYDHMLLPMSLMLVFVLGATIFSVAQSLRPVQEAARKVARLDPRAETAQLPTADMPREIAEFTQAVNAAFSRAAELMRSQKLLTSAISHEVRTPLAVARLELEKIADPRARKVEEDLNALNHLVEQLTDLARVEAAPLAVLEKIEPAALAGQVVSDLADLVYRAGKSISFADRGATPFLGHPALVENALRNLVENAVRHAPAGAEIRVEVGPGAALAVIDDGGGKSPTGQPASGRGLGLQIVGRIAEIHHAAFDWTRKETGVTARLDFAPKRKPT
ncbi:signal transduction histidine kinase [Rhodoblastus acidophilus]|uniref:sensor histidine kinase n=1 Tax=Rhodoblastus acidophilus TaxID=1074 RepID=UPI002224CFBD|nr:ATP-binding protein [Rhodoblastus acidophilus]MCW2284109.1 signal transduction histidine kinase [Rhodoblastus acidophilus]MCW2332805.1 signal transduction histidine kinase [Rhodoblastus acidophilus]